MDASSESVTVSVRYRPGNLLTRPPVKVVIDDKESFSLSNEGVKRIMLTPGTHNLKLKCRLKKENISFDIENPARITIGFCECGKIKTKISTVDSVDELDYERIGY